MTIKDELIKYAIDCIEDKYVDEYEDYISGRKHKMACQRFLNDINRIGDEDFEYYWNEQEAQLIVDWFAYLKHSKGVLANKPIILNTWQKFCLCQIYGWRHIKTDYKRFNKSFIEVARKNAKSQMEAGVVLYEMAVQSTRNNEVYECYCAGTKRDQSNIIFNECKLMLRGSVMKLKFKITKDRIEHIKTGSFLKALCKEDGKTGDGTNPAILVLDEYHQHKTTEFYDLGYGANTKESLLMIITTAGVDLTFPCFTQEYAYCSKIVNPDIDVVNDRYFVDILEVDHDDDIRDIRNWKKANPIRMTYHEGVTKIQDEWKIAKEIPEKLPSFKTKCLNIWVQAKNNGYMNMQKWKNCEVKELPRDVKGLTCFIGGDMSAKIDLTSLAFVIPYMVGDVKHYIVFSHSFIPNEEKLRERIIKDKMPYGSWVDQGFITITNTPIVDQQQVVDYGIKFCDEIGVKIDTWCFDPANATKIMMDLSNEGYVVEELYQSYRMLNESTCALREEIYKGVVHYLPNPVLNFAMSNAIVRKNNGLIKIDKDASVQRIDPVDALICGFKMAWLADLDVEIPEITDEYLNELGW